MPHYDNEGRWVAQPIAKGEGKARKTKGTATPEKVVKRDSKPDLEAAKEVVKKKGGSGPRTSGNRIERLVAKSLDGERTPGSGAYKHTNRNLTGDVEIPDNEGKNFVKLEVKATGAVSASGEKSYTIKQSELKQMQREADEAHELGALVFHFKGESIENAWAIVSMKTLKEFIEDAKFARSARK